MQNTHTRRRALISMLGLASLPLAAQEPEPVVPAYNNLTDQQEIELGEQIAKEIEKQRKLPIIVRPSLQNYVDQVFQQVVKTCRRPNLPYSIKIVDTAAVNAFSIPGGFVYLNRGLMSFAQNEAELTSVLAHEVGHVVGRHAANNICRQNTADSLLSEASHTLFGDDTPARLVKQVGSPLAMIALLKYSRDQESEADLLGFYNMQRAGWHPRAMVGFFRRLDRDPEDLQTLLALASDHPASAGRANELASEIRRVPPDDSLKIDSPAFHVMQDELKTLPPPPKSDRS